MIFSIPTLRSSQKVLRPSPSFRICVGIREAPESASTLGEACRYTVAHRGTAVGVLHFADAAELGHGCRQWHSGVTRHSIEHSHSILVDVAIRDFPEVHDHGGAPSNHVRHGHAVEIELPEILQLATAAPKEAHRAVDCHRLYDVAANERLAGSVAEVEERPLRLQHTPDAEPRAEACVRA